VGFHQTTEHRKGKHSYHQIGLVRGQFGDVPEDRWLDFIQKTGFDGWEEASWELDLSRCGDDAGAQAYARERLAKAKSRGLEIFTIAVHLQGQVLGDEPSYKAWRQAGNEPPRTDPYFVPADVGRLMHQGALKSLIACARLAHFLGKEQNRTVVLPGFVGSPAHCWASWFLFPPLPSSIGGHAIRDVREVSLELLVERFGPFLEACKKYGTRFGLECHPTERAMGDLESAGDFLRAMEKAGFGSVAGFNFDSSHMEWQNVSGVQFIREYGAHIYSAHIKGVQVIRQYTRAGRLGGHRPMGHKENGWNFVTAGTARDAVSVEEIMVELNRSGFDGAVNIEWEDNDVEKHDGARTALANVHRGDCAPSLTRHDETLKA
jgi:sugar phosphate isomerase/epimerase